VAKNRHLGTIAQICPVISSQLVFLAAARYPDPPNFDPPPKIRQKNAAAENTAEF